MCTSGSEQRRENINLITAKMPSLEVGQPIHGAVIPKDPHCPQRKSYTVEVNEAHTYITQDSALIQNSENLTKH